MPIMAVMEWYDMATNRPVIGVYMERAGKIQIINKNGIEKTAMIKKFWTNQDLH